VRLCVLPLPYPRRRGRPATGRCIRVPSTWRCAVDERSRTGAGKEGMMYTATINFQTRIKSDGVGFSLVEFNPNVPGVSKVEIEAPNGHEIHGTIYLTAVLDLQTREQLKVGPDSRRGD
jgi:hypothetical protein